MSAVRFMTLVDAKGLSIDGLTGFVVPGGSPETSLVMERECLSLRGAALMFPAVQHLSRARRTYPQ